VVKVSLQADTEKIDIEIQDNLRSLKLSEQSETVITPESISNPYDSKVVNGSFGSNEKFICMGKGYIQYYSAFDFKTSTLKYYVRGAYGKPLLLPKELTPQQVIKLATGKLTPYPALATNFKDNLQTLELFVKNYINAALLGKVNHADVSEFHRVINVFKKLIGETNWENSKIGVLVGQGSTNLARIEANGKKLAKALLKLLEKEKNSNKAEMIELKKLLAQTRIFLEQHGNVVVNNTLKKAGVINITLERNLNEKLNKGINIVADTNYPASNLRL
jgi:hypothetical protein